MKNITGKEESKIKNNPVFKNFTVKNNSFSSGNMLSAKR